MTKKIYFNGNIITVDKKESVVEAMLVENGQIKAVGTKEEVLGLADDKTTNVDLEGKTILPGFIDPHGHIVAMSQVLLIASLGQVSSKEELLASLNYRYTRRTMDNRIWV